MGQCPICALDRARRLLRYNPDSPDPKAHMSQRSLQMPARAQIELAHQLALDTLDDACAKQKWCDEHLLDDTDNLNAEFIDLMKKAQGIYRQALGSGEPIRWEAHSSLHFAHTRGWLLQIVTASLTGISFELFRKEKGQLVSVAVGLLRKVSEDHAKRILETMLRFYQAESE